MDQWRGSCPEKNAAATAWDYHHYQDRILIGRKAPAHVENPIERMKISVSRPFLSLGPCPYASKSASDGRKTGKESDSDEATENDDRSDVDDCEIAVKR